MPTTSLERVETNLAQLRLKRALSAASLARMVQVTRQTIHAIEAGDYVPNTAVALRLARALEVSVDDLFALPAPVIPAERARFLDSEAPEAGEPVQLCRVDKQLIATSARFDPWYVPTSDGITTTHSRVQSYHAKNDDDYRNRVLLAGCDPAVSVLARHLQPAGVDLTFIQRNSSQSLQLLRKNCVHIAGTHLRDEASGESNLAEIRRMFPKNSVALISFAVWEEGLVIGKANPKRIKGVQDLTRRGVSIINRERGAGSRRLLDDRLKQLNLESNQIRGYDRMANGHFSAARQVAERRADCCIATRATARAFGLDFIPLVTERYDLAIRRQHLQLPAVQTLLDVLNRSAFRRELEGIGGYETRVSGQRLM